MHFKQQVFSSDFFKFRYAYLNIYIDLCIYDQELKNLFIWSWRNMIITDQFFLSSFSR